MMGVAQPMLTLVAKVALPMIVHRHPGEVRQDGDVGKRLPPPLGVRRVVRQQPGARHVQPVQRAADAHPGLVKTRHRLPSDRLSDHLDHPRQALPTGSVDVRQGPLADRDREQVLEQLGRPPIRQQSIRAQIHRHRLQPAPVLDRLLHANGELGDRDLPTVRAALAFAAVFGDLHRKRRHIEYLTAFVAGYRLFGQRSAASADFHRVHRLRRRFLYLTQGRARMARLPARTLAALCA